MDVIKYRELHGAYKSNKYLKLLKKCFYSNKGFYNLQLNLKVYFLINIF